MGLGNFLLELLVLLGDLDGELLDLERQFLDLGLISTAILLERQVILLLLSGGEGPLLELFLVPVHLKFELIHLLVGLEDHVLDVVQTVLLVSDAVVQFLDLVPQTA